MAVNAKGDVFIADTFNNVVREVTPGGSISTVAGNGTAGYRGDNGPAWRAELSSPTGLAVDALGNLYVADSGNNVIRRVSTNGIITTVAGDVAADQPSGGLGGFSGDGGPATQARLNSPQGVALDQAGDLFIADTFNNAVREVTPNGTISTIVDTTAAKREQRQRRAGRSGEAQHALRRRGGRRHGGPVRRRHLQQQGARRHGLRRPDHHRRWPGGPHAPHAAPAPPPLSTPSHPSPRPFVTPTKEDSHDH